MRRSTRVVLLLVVVLVLAGIAWKAFHHPAEDSALKAKYTKHEYRIPMRDGAKLFTAVYVPKDSSRKYPFLVWRTPYGVIPYGTEHFPKRLGPSDSFDRAGYIFVFQDVRGRYQSEGQYLEARPHIDNPKPGDVDESTDMYDTVEWLLKNVQNNNGRVGIWGNSYPGFYASASMIDSHPAIKACSPEAPVTDMFRGDDIYHNGALMLSATFAFYSSFFHPRTAETEMPNFQPFDYGTDDGYQFFQQHDLGELASRIHNPWFDAAIQHNKYDDYWQSRDISRHLHGVRCAVLTVGGWFDAEDLAGPLRTYRAIEQQNPGTENMLVMGPWQHGAWIRLPDGGPERVAANAAQYYREHIVFPFFEHYLKGADEPRRPEAQVFETGTNTWKRYDAWPPKNLEAKTLYLRANGKLSFDPPKANEAEFDEYVSDPANPVPYVANPPTDPAAEYMYGDQLFLAGRKDVLTYVSEPLTEDVTIAGPVSPRLSVSSSGSDSDFVVKLIDVFPGDANSSSGANSSAPANSSSAAQPKGEPPVASAATAGYEELIRGEPMRARFRNSLSAPEPLTPNQVTPLRFDMPDVNHTFLRGHRIMVQVQSSWFPLTDMNPQTFINPATAKHAQFVKATERVYHSLKAQSGVGVGVVRK